jgi:hypothetical protein
MLRKTLLKQSGRSEILNMVTSGCYQHNDESFVIAHKGRISTAVNRVVSWWLRAGVSRLMGCQILSVFYLLSF